MHVVNIPTAQSHPPHSTFGRTDAMLDSQKICVALNISQACNRTTSRDEHKRYSRRKKGMKETHGIGSSPAGTCHKRSQTRQETQEGKLWTGKTISRGHSLENITMACKLSTRTKEERKLTAQQPVLKEPVRSLQSVTNLRRMSQPLHPVDQSCT